MRTCSRICVPRLAVALDVRFLLFIRLCSRCVCQRRSDVHELRRFYRHHVHSCAKCSLPTSGRRNAVATSTVQSKKKYTKQDVDIHDMGMTKCFHGQTLMQAQVHCVVLGNRRASLLQLSSCKCLRQLSPHPTPAASLFPSTSIVCPLFGRCHDARVRVRVGSGASLATASK